MSRSNIRDFQIIQRDADGFARVTYSLTLPASADEGKTVMVRIVSEEDGVQIVPWTDAVIRNGDARFWETELTIPEGGLYRLEAVLTGTGPWVEMLERVDCVYHIGVGDIWVMAGQSNMSGYGMDPAYDPATLGVHVFTRRGVWSIAEHPLCDSLDNIYGYDENKCASSPALSFARRLHEKLSIPIGLIPAAVGGTPLSSWDPAEEGDCFEKLCRIVKDAGTFRGMIWYQGCIDTYPERCHDYLERFTRAVGLWRKDFGNFPILTVQLNRWMACNDSRREREWGMIRDAQRRAALTVPGVFCVPSLDAVTTDGIHNGAPSNLVIGERLALCALAEVYHKPGQTAASVLSAEKIDDTHIKLTVTPGHRVEAMDNVAPGMNIEDAGGMIDCTTVKAVPDGLIVTAPRPISFPAYFHYAWRCHSPAFFVRDRSGMPLLSCYHIEIKSV